MIFLKSPETFDDRLCHPVLVLSWPAVPMTMITMMIILFMMVIMHGDGHDHVHCHGDRDHMIVVKVKMLVTTNLT